MCGNSTDGSSPNVFQGNFLSAIQVKLAMEKVDNVEDILNVQKRIDTGCIAMGLKPLCGVAK